MSRELFKSLFTILVENRRLAVSNRDCAVSRANHEDRVDLGRGKLRKELPKVKAVILVML